jgi:hypothetical protein
MNLGAFSWKKFLPASDFPLAAVAARRGIFFRRSPSRLFSAPQPGAEKRRSGNFATGTQQKEDSMAYGRGGRRHSPERILNGISRLLILPHDLR